MGLKEILYRGKHIEKPIIPLQIFYNLNMFYMDNSKNIKSSTFK